MNTSTRRGAAAPARYLSGHRTLSGFAWAVATTAASFGVGAWALAAASGVTQISGTDYNTEFIDGTVSWLATLLLVGVYLATARHVAAGLLAAVGLVAGQAWAMTVCIQRYIDSGWGDGLEVLGYLGPIFLGFYALVVILVTWLVRRKR